MKSLMTLQTLKTLSKVIIGSSVLVGTGYGVKTLYEKQQEKKITSEVTGLKIITKVEKKQQKKELKNEKYKGQEKKKIKPSSRLTPKEKNIILNIRLGQSTYDFKGKKNKITPFMKLKYSPYVQQ